MRDTEYQFVDTNTETIVSNIISEYERLTGRTVPPASPENMLIRWVAGIIVQERVYNNYTGNQNLPSRAEGINLDALGEQIFNVSRPKSQAAFCTMRFYFSEELPSAALIPAGTRVTDAGQSLFWETREDIYLPIGEVSVDVMVQCQTEGNIGNDFAIGQINRLVDIFPYYWRCENINVTAGGADDYNDEEYYNLMRLSLDGYSTAGAVGAYEYYAKRVSKDIADVLVNSPNAGEVDLYVLMRDGTLADTEIKNAVLSACSADHVRPLTDLVAVKDAETVSFNVEFTYYIPRLATQDSVDIEQAINRAVSDYVTWQGGKLGRDINPSYLMGKLMQTGIKRADLTEPVFTVLRDGADNTVPQVAVLGSVTLVNGGYEDE